MRESSGEAGAEIRGLSEALINSFGDGVIILNEYGNIIQVNKKALQMLGFKPYELIGQWFPKVLPSRDREGNEVSTYDRPAVKALLTGEPSSEVVGYIRKDGSLLPVANTSSPFTIDGKPKGAVVIFRDFSREVQAEKAKDEFISLTSHQLRSPLTSIRLFTDILQDTATGKLNKVQKEHLEKIRASTDRMLELVESFLNISKLEMGRLDPQPAPTDLDRLINMQMAELEPLLAEKKVKIKFEKISEISSIKVDASLLAEALHNLLTNAIRYAPSKNGQIKIGVECKGDACIIFVSDNGIGIPEDAKDKMFERFYRADNAQEFQEAGTGLGLYLVKKIVESLKGRIWFESRENKGTTFYLSLPHSPR